MLQLKVVLVNFLLSILIGFFIYKIAIASPGGGFTLSSAALFAIPVVKESKAGGEHSYDIPGVLTATLGLFSLVYGFNRAATVGWTATETIALLLASAILLGTFITIEMRVRNPLMPMRVVLERNRGGSYLSSLIIGAGIFSIFLFLGIYLQSVLGYSPLKSGFAFLPFTFGIFFAAAFASKMLPKIGPRPLMVPGLLLSAVGLLFLTRITPETSYLTHVLPVLPVISFGLGLVFIPTSSTSLHGIGNQDAGVASALINTSQQVGGSLGTALLNTVAATSTASFIANHPELGPKLINVAMVHGFTIAFKCGAALLVVGAFVVFFFINIGKEAIIESEGVIAGH
jgi:predicted MFS family arabinose efflux permease